MVHTSSNEVPAMLLENVITFLRFQPLNAVNGLTKKIAPFRNTLKIGESHNLVNNL